MPELAACGKLIASHLFQCSAIIEENLKNQRIFLK